MLRSLVGSEMCIRDRSLDAGGYWYTRHRFTQGLHVSGGDVEFLAYNPLCLLYTSDAADDLPCVDLGGRRIIKKKIIPVTNPTYRPYSPTT